MSQPVTYKLQVTSQQVISYTLKVTSYRYALIRDDFAAVVLPALTKTWGIEWLAEIVVPVLKECAEHKQYQVKSVLLPALLALQVRWGAPSAAKGEGLPPFRSVLWRSLPPAATAAPAASWVDEMANELGDGGEEAWVGSVEVWVFWEGLIDGHMNCFQGMYAGQL